MNIYSGVDIIEIDRINELINRWQDRFTNRVFTDRELEYSQNKAFPFSHLAARFSAKEAVIKALGNFNIRKLKLRDIEVLNSIRGKPRIVLHNHIEKFCRDNDINIELSLSHTRKFAVANAIAIKK